MKTYPKKNKRAKTRSNLRHTRVLEFRKACLLELDKIYVRTSRDFMRGTRKLFLKASLRAAASIVNQVKEDWHESNLVADGDSRSWSVRKGAARARLKRLLAKALPEFRNWEKLRREHLEQYRNLATAQFNTLTANQLPLGWAVVMPPLVTNLRRYVAPFPVVDVGKVDDDNFIKSDESSVLPQSGIFINDLVFDHDEDTAIILGVYGLPGRARASGLAACGINYTMPRTGRLYISAELNNIYNHATLSLQDSFGLSDGKLHVTINLVINVVRLHEVISLPKILFTTTLLSEGDDTHSVMPDLEPVYMWDRSTSEVFMEDEAVSILVGAEVQVRSELDDMQSHVEAVFAWQLKRLSVGIM